MPPEIETDDAVETEPDLRTLLNSAFDEQEVKDTPADPPEKPETQGEARQRGPDGKFAKAEPDEVAETVEKPIADKPVDDKPADETKPAPNTAPAHWSAGDKEAFAELTLKAQAAWLRRDQEMTADYTRKTQEIATLRRDYEPVQAMFAPHEAELRAKGFTPSTLIKGWADAELALGNPATAPKLIQTLVANYKIDRAQIAQLLGITPGTGLPPAPEGQTSAIPPEVATELSDLRNRQSQFDQFLTAQQQRERREQENRVMSTITAFRDAKDDKGTLLHPHYDELEGQMIRLLIAERTGGREPPLEELYETAVWANTSTRDKILTERSAADEAQRKATEKKTADEARAKAERARKASSSVTGAPGSGQARMRQSQDENRSVRDELNAAYEEMAEP